MNRPSSGDGLDHLGIWVAVVLDSVLDLPSEFGAEVLLEEPCGGKDQGAGADACDRLFRAKVQELREELPVLHNLRPSRASGNDDQVEIGEVSKHFMREEFHAEGGRDFFFYGAKADCQV